MNRRLAALLAILASIAAAPSRADDVAEAKARFRRGAELYAEKRWREAAAEFEAAYRLKPHGAIHYNVAQCRERLGEWPAAIRAYHDYLRELPGAKDRVAVRAAIRSLEERLQATGAQPLLVYSDPPGAEVRVDGKPHGRTPLHVVLPPGTYALALALSGHEPATHEVVHDAGAARVVDVELRVARPSVAAKAASDGAAPPSARPEPIPGATAATRPDLRPPPTAAPEPRTLGPAKAKAKRRVWTWVSTAAAVAAAGAGAYHGLEARRSSDALLDGTKRTDPEATQLADRAKRFERRANILYGAAALAGAAGTTLFFVEGRF